VNEAPAPLSQYMNEVPPILQHTLKKMLAKEPDQRYQHVHDVRTDLDELNVTSGESEVSATVAAASPAKRSYLWPTVAGGGDGPCLLGSTYRRRCACSSAEVSRRNDRSGPRRPETLSWNM
jgi:hypothetical protein